MMPEPPVGLLAELTHGCPLRCPYCSNPLELERRSGELTTRDWRRVFQEAGALGVLHLHLSGGEPTLREDIVELVAAARQAGLYANLITSGVGRAGRVLEAMAAAGLDHVQLSIQAADAPTADRIAGANGAHARKLAFAEQVRRLDLPLTVNAVIHRHNVGQVEAMVHLAADLGAGRVEIAHAQYYGWGLASRRALMPRRSDVALSSVKVAALRERYLGRLEIDYVAADYHARYPKPCAGGWGRRLINVTPGGRALPCHAAETIPGLVAWSVRERSLEDIWFRSPAFNQFRGVDWMQEPCRTCPRQEVDWGGCRCQALALTGDVRAADPACSLSPWHERLVALAEEEGEIEARLRYRAGPRESAASALPEQADGRRP